MKRKLALICVMVMVITSIAQTVGAVNVIMNSSFLKFPDQEPVIENGRTLVPIRPIAEALGLEIAWDDPTDTVTLKKDNFYVSLVIGQTTAKTSSGEKTLDVAPVIINGRTMVPLRFIAEAMGLTVLWNDQYQRVIINGQVDTETVIVPEVTEDATAIEGEVTEMPSEGETMVEEPTEEETEFVDLSVYAIAEAQSSSVNFVVPEIFFPEDPDSEESFAYRSLDAFDAQHTYNWEMVSSYESYADESGTNGIIFVVQNYDPYEGDAYDVSDMNRPYPEAPQRPQFPELDWEVMQFEMERVLLEQVFVDMGVEIPEDVMSMETEEVLALLGLESEDALSEQLGISMENADLSLVPGYDDYIAWQEEQQIYNEDKKIYDEEYREISAVKNYVLRHFPDLYSQAGDEEWVEFFSTIFNTDEEVRYESVEIVEVDGKPVVHATIYAEDPDDEQGVYDYYHYIDGDSVVTIFGGTLSGGEPSAEAVEAIGQMMIQ